MSLSTGWAEKTPPELATASPWCPPSPRGIRSSHDGGSPRERSRTASRPCAPTRSLTPPIGSMALPPRAPARAGRGGRPPRARFRGPPFVGPQRKGPRRARWMSPRSRRPPPRSSRDLRPSKSSRIHSLPSTSRIDRPTRASQHPLSELRHPVPSDIDIRERPTERPLSPAPPAPPLPPAPSLELPARTIESVPGPDIERRVRTRIGPTSGDALSTAGQRVRSLFVRCIPPASPCARCATGST